MDTLFFILRFIYGTLAVISCGYLLLFFLFVCLSLLNKHLNKEQMLIDRLNFLKTKRIKAYVEQLNLQEKENFSKICQNYWYDLAINKASFQILIDLGFDINQPFIHNQQVESIFTLCAQDCEDLWSDTVSHPEKWLDTLLEYYRHDLPQLKLFQEQVHKSQFNFKYVFGTEEKNQEQPLFHKLAEYLIMAEQEVLEKQTLLLIELTQKNKLSKI